MYNQRMLTPDSDIISVHPINQQAKWVDGKCSVCGSINPAQFVADLATESLVSGWKTGAKHPDKVYGCKTVSGDFYLVHLQDMPCLWLEAHQTEIVINTGLLPYWDGECIKWKAFVPVKNLVGFKCLTPKEVAAVQSFLQELRARA